MCLWKNFSYENSKSIFITDLNSCSNIHYFARVMRHLSHTIINENRDNPFASRGWEQSTAVNGLGKFALRGAEAAEQWTTMWSGLERIMRACFMVVSVTHVSLRHGKNVGKSFFMFRLTVFMRIPSIFTNRWEAACTLGLFIKWERGVQSRR